MGSLCAQVFQLENCITVIRYPESGAAASPGTLVSIVRTELHALQEPYVIQLWNEDGQPLWNEFRLAYWRMQESCLTRAVSSYWPAYFNLLQTYWSSSKQLSSKYLFGKMHGHIIHVGVKDLPASQ